jgi:integrase
MRGSIRKRGSSFTAYWFTTDPATGKRRQHSKGGFRTKTEAQGHLNAVMSNVEDGTWRADNPMTLKVLLTDYWLPSQESRGLRAATISQYRLATNHWIIPHIGATKIAALTPANVTALVHTLRTAKTAKGRDGLSSRSTQVTVGVLKSAYTWAVNNGLLNRNPISGVQRPKVQRTATTTWQPEEARGFLKATSEDRLAVAWALLLTRGLRRGEVCGLRWSKIDLERGVLQVEATRVVVDGEVHESTPKTESGRRSVPLDPALVGLLRSHKASQSAEKLAAGEAYKDDGFLLADELGRAYHPDTISNWFDVAVKEADLPRIRSSPTITLAIYAHTLPSMAQDAGAALSAILFGDVG